MTYFQRLVVNTLAFISLSVIFPSMFYVGNFMIAVIASFVLSILNLFIRPILHILSLPITILTFGLFSFVINGFMLMITSNIVGKTEFAFSSFYSAVFISLILSFVNSVVSNYHANKY